MRDILGIVSVKKAAEGRKDTMWIDPERYPVIADTDLVCTRISHLFIIGYFNNTSRQALQAVEVELMEELKSIRKILKKPSLAWTSAVGEEVPNYSHNLLCPFLLIIYLVSSRGQEERKS